MRLIDADAVEKYFYEHLDDLHMAAAMNAINEMPTVDAEPVKHGKWLVTWQCHNYHEMDSGDYAYQYSECMVHVTCSVCCKDSDSFKWDKSGKGKNGIAGLAYKMQIAKMNALKTKFCPHCGAKMDEN